MKMKAVTWPLCNVTSQIVGLDQSKEPCTDCIML